MIILVTRTNDAHADILIERLRELKADFLRLNWDNFPQRIKATLDFTELVWHAKFALPLGRTLDCSKVTAGWCRSQPSAVVADTIEPQFAKRIAFQESETTIQDIISLLADKYWINHPQQMRVAYSKLLQLKIAQELGFRTPITRVTNDPSEFESFYKSHPGRKITKMIGLPWRLAEDGYLIFTNVIDEQKSANIDSVDICPTLIQEFVEKDVELRVTIVENVVFAMEIKSQLLPETIVDWRRAPIEEIKKISTAINIPTDLANKCIQLLKKFGLNYGAFDFIVTPQGEVVFLEMNPHGAWGFVEHCTEQPISHTIAKCLATAN